MKKRNKAQVTLYLIIAVVFLFVILIGFYYIKDIGSKKSETIEKVENIPEKFQPIDYYISNCLKKSSISATYFSGQQGGYYTLPFEVLSTGYLNLPYYYLEKNIMPSKENVEKELSEAVKKDVDSCIDLSVFKSQGFNIAEKEKSASTKILDDKVVVTLDYSLSVEKDNTNYIKSKFLYEVPVRLGHLYNIAMELTNKIVKEPYYSDLTFLLGQDLDISIINSDACNKIYLIADTSKKPGLSNFIYLFASEIDQKYCDSEIKNTALSELKDFKNRPPVITLPDYLAAEAGKNFFSKIEAFDPENDKIFFLDDSDMFQIHPLLGTINFTPSQSQIGLHKINVTVVDINGLYDSQTFYLEIK